MWFSSGGTKSVLHNDVFENINCVLDGTKQLLMINRSLANVIETPAAGWDRQSNSAASIDVDAVDLTKLVL
jgi:lysine-specific demethylase 8